MADRSKAEAHTGPTTASSLVLVLLAAVAGSCAGPRTTGTQSEVAGASVAAAPVDPESVLVPGGTYLMVRTTQPIDSRRHGAGYRFMTQLEADLLDKDGNVLAPRGTSVYGQLAQAKSAGRLAGKSQITIVMTDIMLGNRLTKISTTGLQAAGQGSGRNTAGRVGAGAAIGGIAGGSSGARTGAAIGLGTAVLSDGQQINIPANTLLEFSLAAPITK